MDIAQQGMTPHRMKQQQGEWEALHQDSCSRASSFQASGTMASRKMTKQGARLHRQSKRGCGEHRQGSAAL